MAIPYVVEYFFLEKYSSFQTPIGGIYTMKGHRGVAGVFKTDFIERKLEKVLSVDMSSRSVPVIAHILYKNNIGGRNRVFDLAFYADSHFSTSRRPNEVMSYNLCDIKSADSDRRQFSSDLFATNRIWET